MLGALLPGCISIPVGSFFSLQLPCGYGGFPLFYGCMSRDAFVADGCWFRVLSLNEVDGATLLTEPYLWCALDCSLLSYFSGDWLISMLIWLAWR
ncbi:hypothetical protein Nepgr_007982 [Nepenthes gracilis]|uniref:Uncharacterized protein n=1 Tax=Nepenthes gracilis TaxID=150966 RepID=A0AAD3S7W5_NEPGR|nr:hypothetical protein Nepgr_007982 [Nepenthes gracilis]